MRRREERDSRDWAGSGHHQACKCDALSTEQAAAGSNAEPGGVGGELRAGGPRAPYPILEIDQWLPAR